MIVNESNFIFSLSHQSSFQKLIFFLGIFEISKKKSSALCEQVCSVANLKDKSISQSSMAFKKVRPRSLTKAPVFLLTLPYPAIYTLPSVPGYRPWEDPPLLLPQHRPQTIVVKLQTIVVKLQTRVVFPKSFKKIILTRVLRD